MCGLRVEDVDFLQGIVTLWSSTRPNRSRPNSVTESGHQIGPWQLQRGHQDRQEHRGTPAFGSGAPPLVRVGPMSARHP